MQYKEVRNYAFNYIMKDYANFPRFLPMPCHMEHGWTATTEAEKSDLATDKPLMMVFSKRREKAWKQQSNIPVVVMGSPFIHYKNAHNLRIHPEAKGTVVFPCHSTYDLKSQYSIKDYCKELKKLPRDFHPITICLFWLDYIDPKAEIYRKAGFKVVSAGPKITNSLEFVKNFYKILSHHKYATSNEIGTYTFYSVDLGISFFLSGQSPVILNDKLKDINVGKVTRIEDFDFGKKAIDIFSTGPIKQISQAQKNFVDEEMGTNDCISREKMHELFTNCYEENNYWLKVFPRYLIDSLWTAVLFNGPFVKLLISLRKRIG